jgi:hypothetical protein
LRACEALLDGTPSAYSTPMTKTAEIADHQ